MVLDTGYATDTNCSEVADMSEEVDTIANTIVYKHELSGDIRETQGRIVKNHKICGYSLYRLEKISESYQVNGNSAQTVY